MMDTSAVSKAAVAQDEEIAQSQVNAMSDQDIDEILAMATEEDGYTPTPAGYTLEIAKIDKLIDKVELLRHTMIGVMGGKSKEKFRPEPRPKSEFQKALDKRKWTREKELNDQEMKNFGF